MSRLPSRVISISLLFILVYSQLVSPVYAQQTENMSVTASVMPRPVDYQFTTQVEPQNGPLPQGTELTYILKYGSYLDTGTSPVTIEATLLPGRVTGTTISSLYPAEYVSGSATVGYGNTEPTYTSSTHTLAWTIQNLPAQTSDQTISFKVKLNDSYTGIENVDFDVQFRFTTPYLTLNQTITKNYLYHHTSTTPTPTPSSFPQPSPAPLNIESTDTTTVTSETVTVVVTSSTPATSVLYFGTNPDEMTGSIRISEPRLYHTFTVLKLLPDTTYYYYIIVTDSLGRSYRSTRYSFHTAVISTPSRIDRASLIISSSNTIFNPSVYDGNTGTQSATLTLPVNTEYGIQVRLPDPVNVVKVQALLRNADVLGIFSNILSTGPLALSPDPVTDSVTMTEASPGLFMGTLKTKPRTGNYDMIIRVSDVFGNSTEELIGKLHVVRPFTVLWDESGKPVGNARIFLSRYNSKSDQYIALSPTFLSTRNPLVTSSTGEAAFVLPEGRYKAYVSYNGAEKTVLFTIGKTSLSGFPVVRLTTPAFSLPSLLRYYASTALDVVLYQTIEYIELLRNSLGLYDLTAALSLTALLFLTALSFISRTFIRITEIPNYIIHMIHSLVSNTGNIRYIAGTVIDGDSRRPVPLAYVTIADSASHAVTATLRTDRAGHYFHAVRHGTYHIQIIKRGYELLEPILYRPDLSPYHIIHVLYATQFHKKNAFSAIAHTISTLFGLLFEILLGFSVIFELLFMEYFGFIKTLPFFLVSLANILIWRLYIHHIRSHTIEP